MGSGNTIGEFFPGEGYQPASAGASMAQLANNEYAIQFPSSGAASWIWEWIVPDTYGGATGITAKIWWAGNTATTGNVIWTVYFQLRTAGGTAFGTDSFNSTNNDSAALATNGTILVPVTTTIAIAAGANTTASVAAHSRARVKVTRRLAAGDTMSGFANFHGLELTDT